MTLILRTSLHQSSLHQRHMAQKDSLKKASGKWLETGSKRPLQRLGESSTVEEINGVYSLSETCLKQQRKLHEKWISQKYARRSSQTTLHFIFTENY